jgi:hypothetical protein
MPTPYTQGMAELPEGTDVEREQVRAHYRAELARVAAIPADAREAELHIVREVAAAHRRNAA